MKKILISAWILVGLSMGCAPVVVQDNIATSAKSTTQAAISHVPVEPGDTPLITASRRGDLAAVQTLLASGADVNAANERGTTALMAASQQGHTAILNALATHAHLNLEATDWNMDTALLIAVQHQQVESVKTLLALGANVHYAKAGMTLLIAASYKGNAEIVQALLDAGANPALTDENGETALDVAINTNQPAVAAVLRQYQHKK